MDSSPRLFTAATRIAPEAGSHETETYPWSLQEIETEGAPIPEPGATEMGAMRLPLCGSWLHAYSPSEHTYPCEDDESCGCVHCAGESCDCEDCSC